MQIKIISWFVTKQMEVQVIIMCRNDNITIHFEIICWEYKLIRSVSLKIAPAVVNGS